MIKKSRLQQRLQTSIVLVIVLLQGCALDGWRTASRESAGIAPDPATNSEAIVQVYGAPTWGWRGWFAIHTWISMKAKDAERYTVYEVIGWRKRRGMSVVRIAEDIPDRYWYGERPELLLDRRGSDAERLIPLIDKAARDYPWPNDYRVWPGPNSNTFPAWIGQQVPELELELPISAIGKGYID